MNLKKRLGLCWRILRADTGNLFDHAERELPKPEGADSMQALMNEQLKEMILVFSTHGHSGFSASWARHCLGLLLDFKPLGPLTGAPEEWGEPFDLDEGTQQNKRCGHVFKGRDGVAYDSQGRVFREPNGSTYLSRESRVNITFPYTPTTEYVDVPA